MTALVDAQDLHFRYAQRRVGMRRDRGDWALRGLNMSIETGSAVGIVGETGSGKSTLIRILCGLLPIVSGSVAVSGRNISEWLRETPMEFRRRNQMVFQNPASSFDPRMRVRQSLAEPLRAIERRRPSEEELLTWLSQVGLGPDVLSRYPHQISGGQLQRVAIARGISVAPKILYADEPTSALDVSVQAQVLNLLMDLRTRLGLTLVMVSHDLAVVSRICEQIVVMKDGGIVEAGATIDVLQDPAASYTRKLVEASASVSLTPAEE